MIDKICKNCKHFIKGDDTYGHDCSMTCASPKVKKSYESGCPDGGIRVEDDEGWGIIVSPTFGCINWENK